jgi:hypothetical protein
MEMKVVAGFFGGLEVGLMDEPDTPEAAAALNQFLQLTMAHRLAASRHVYAYYLDFHHAVGGEDWLDAQMGIPESPEAIWDHVQPKAIFFEVDRNAQTIAPYVVVECDCDWDEEHGLMLCFLGGEKLTKCGGYDGHVTNRNAYADDSLIGVVYAAINPIYTTRLDP